MERYWLKSQNRFAGVIHRFNFVFQPARRAGGGAEFAGGVDEHKRGVGGYESVPDVADKAAVTQVCTMFVRADADNVIGRGHVGTGIFSQGYVAGTHGIEIQRTITNGRVLESGGVGKERVNAHGRVEGACGVGKESERSIGCVVRTGCVTQKRPGTSGCILVSGVGEERPGADGRVELAFCVASERQKTDCCIEPAAGEAQKRGLSLCRVASRIPAIWRRDNRLRHVEQRKEAKREENARTMLHIMARWGKK